MNAFSFFRSFLGPAGWEAKRVQSLLDDARAPRSRALAEAVCDWNNNQPSLPSLYSDYSVPVVVVGEDGRREVRDKRWGMPTPKKKLLDAAAKRADKLRASCGPRS